MAQPPAPHPDAGPQAFAPGASHPPGPNPFAAAARPPAPPPARRPGRAARLLAGLLVSLLTALLLAVGAAWWWMGTPQSLATALAQAEVILPAGQQLESREVAGNLRDGGHIGWLRWRSATLSVEVQDLRLGWTLIPLLQGTAQIDRLQATSVRITPTPSADAPPALPPQGLPLPVRVSAAFQIDQIAWNGPTPVHATGLGGRYRHDGEAHWLDITGIALAQGHYSGQARLQARAPMALEAAVDGRVRAALPGAAQPWEWVAHATLRGSLATEAARLQLQAQLRPADDAPATAHPLRADASADIAPWAAQPLLQARTDLQAVDLAALWPGAPATLLHGSVQAGPEDAGWQLTARLRNERPGPWNQLRLPASALDATARFDGTRWNVPEARMQLGSGHIALQGHYTPGNATFAGSAQVHDLRPALLHSQLDAQPLSGAVQARSQDDAVHFTADLRARAPGRADAHPQKLPIRALRAGGHWRQRVLTLQNIDIDALQARLHGEPLVLHLGGAPAANGTLALTLPGATASANGQIGPTTGAGSLRIDLSSATQAQEWLARLPGLAPALGQARLQGQARLDARWQGGWQGLRPLLPLLPATASGAVSEFRIDATASAPRLDLTLPATDGGAALPLQWRGLQATLNGTLARAQATLEGQARRGAYSARWQARLQARAGTTGQWHADVEHLRLQAQDDQHPGTWTFQLARPLAFTLDQTTPATTLQVSAGQATLTGPQPGQVGLRWQPSRATLSGPPRWQTSGEFTGLPLAWAEALRASGTAAPTESALAGDLVFHGGWSLDWADELRASARLERTRGDLRIPNGAQPALPAGVREATVQVEVQGRDLRARLRWDSERAGRITADAGTQLAYASGAWAWPAQAPVSAQVRAFLPDLGAWSALAPPGWRVRGTLNADATLSGHRAAPRWQGRLGADQLALRSPADGVDLRDGRLRTELRGERIDITELRLRGGPGNGTRIPGFSGNRTPAPRDGGLLLGTGSIFWADGAGIGMDVTAQAQALQIQGRADRQASVSGTVRATLEPGRLALRGQLKVDRAALLLPDETAPRLGTDVVVHRTARDRAPPAPTDAPARPRQPPDIAITLDLGPDFALQGQGITTRLEGLLDIRSAATPSLPPRVTGEVRTVQGRYRAWGQELDVETGLIRFNGAHDNPGLDILALRPHLSLRAGVQVSGTAQAPRVRLYSEPDLPDAEKLAWVVLGRSAASGGAEAAMLQQAALALLGGKGNATSTRIAGRLGLDEIGFKGPASGENATGAAVTLGKRLSQDLYVTYERSLSGTLGTLYIFYDLSRHLTLRGQTGASSALDLIYTLRYD